METHQRQVDAAVVGLIEYSHRHCRESESGLTAVESALLDFHFHGMTSTCVRLQSAQKLVHDMRIHQSKLLVSERFRQRTDDREPELLVQLDSRILMLTT